MKKPLIALTLGVLGAISWFSIPEGEDAAGPTSLGMQAPLAGSTGVLPSAEEGVQTPEHTVSVLPATVRGSQIPRQPDAGDHSVTVMPTTPPSESATAGAATPAVSFDFVIHVLDPIEGFPPGTLRAILLTASETEGPLISSRNINSERGAFEFQGAITGPICIKLPRPASEMGLSGLMMTLIMERGGHEKKMADVTLLSKGVVTWDLAESVPLPLRKVKALIDGAKESFQRGQPDSGALSEIARLLADVKMTDEPYQEFGVLHNAFERLGELFTAYPTAIMASSKSLVSSGADWPSLLGVTLAHGMVSDPGARDWISQSALPTAERLAAPSSPPFARIKAGIMVSAFRKAAGLSEKGSLLAAIKDPDPSVRRNSLLALVREMDPDEAFPYVREIFLQDQDPGVRGYAAWCLTRYDKVKLGELWAELEKRASGGEWNSMAALAANGHEKSLMDMINCWGGETRDFYEGCLTRGILFKNAANLTEAHKQSISALLNSPDPRQKANAAMVAMIFDPSKARSVLLSCLDADTVIQSRNLFDDVFKFSLATQDDALRAALERALAKLGSQPKRAEAVRRALAGIPATGR